MRTHFVALVCLLVSCLGCTNAAQKADAKADATCMIAEAGQVAAIYDDQSKSNAEKLAALFDLAPALAACIKSQEAAGAGSGSAR